MLQATGAADTVAHDEPAGQAAQTEAPANAYVPAVAQVVHAVSAVVAANVPAAQVVHTVMPVVPAMVPATQFEHADIPVVAANLPVAQVVAAAPPAQELPAGHAVHAVKPVAVVV